jgi:hypothetical protein
LEEILRAGQIALAAAKGDREAFSASLKPYEEATVKATALHMDEMIGALLVVKPVPSS